MASIAVETMGNNLYQKIKLISKFLDVFKYDLKKIFSNWKQ